ncbi:hypothetical protein phi5_270 [Enterobacter phage phi5]|jgi:hypothetical protein|uniref:Uncharacterized protein n=5 Tax=Pseudotevenvirus TaxID=2842979 RepID=A0A0M4S5W2_9CAUD|nr:hypothetical protein CPT_Margaery86 [Citrobacter phage Margaery]AYJ72945.1 hypothetical protein CPT_Maroon_082 [Citrobacter phage Maroon]QJI53130.1 hypothetical protein EBPL_00089 [Enterobacter phage EBPL]QPX76433.1 hypothetical protein [Cronobacter phage vB_CsaM_SemperBestia]UGO54543.1 hypothetical protein BANACH_162 [Cronobacter phage vB_CsaD_Banach]UGV22902.1 hypothetical protein INVICTA_135 [Cronobacter phage vB_CsaM_Invicta]UPW35504.1 hypothetical protein [Cronobacter phage Dev_CS701]
MKTYNMKELVCFNTRREARAYVLAAGKNTSAVIDLGTDKAVGARWAAVVVIAAPVTPVKTLVLGARKAETLKTSTCNNRGVHNVTVIKKRSFGLRA